MKQRQSDLGERPLLFLAPVMGSMASFAEMIAASYRKQGYEEQAVEVEDSVHADRNDLLAAFGRHRLEYGVEAEKAATIDLIQTLAAALISGKARLGYDEFNILEPQTHKFATPIGDTSDDGSVRLVPAAVAHVLTSMVGQKVDLNDVRKALKPIAKNVNQRMGPRGLKKQIRVWEIPQDKWEEHMDLAASEGPDS